MVTSARGRDAPELTNEERTRLEKDGFCITGDAAGVGMSETYRNSSHVFITSDSVLALFHGMMRQTMLRRDAAMAKILQSKLKDCAHNLDGMNLEEPGADPATCKTAMIRAKIVCGTAIRLLDPDWHGADPAIAREIDAEAARVEAARERVKPGWLGKPEPMFMGLDYSNCNPVGLHETEAGGKRYFRAVRFLQMIPFRLSRKEELYSACYLLRSSEDSNKAGVFRLVFRANAAIGHPAIQASIQALDNMPPGTPLLQGMLGKSMAYHRDEMDEPATPALINNLIADDAIPASEEDSRLISPLFMPDSLVFQQVLERWNSYRPTGRLFPCCVSAWKPWRTSSCAGSVGMMRTAGFSVNSVSGC